MKHGNVAIGADFFKKEIGNYTRWDFAWGREVGQNSLDAGAKNITVMIEPLDDGKSCRVIWVDDGTGMNLDILLNRFMTLGGSHKKDGDVGGMGWAKTLILLAQTSYKIHTNGIILEGIGGEYSYTEDNEQVDGTILDVVLPAYAHTIATHIEYWAEWTDMKGSTIFLNGEKIKTFVDKTVKGTKDIDVDWAELHIVESDRPRLYYRINGQLMGMGNVPPSVKDALIIEITGKSTEYFTANRDQLRYHREVELRGFIKELFQDPTQAIKISKPRSMTVHGQKREIRLDMTDEERKNQMDFLLNNPKALEAVIERQENLPTATHDGHTTIVYNETNQNIPAKFMPGMMSKTNEKLMNRWTAIIETVGRLLNINQFIVPGWTFSTDAMAMWIERDSAMLLNPVHIDDNGKMTQRYKLDAAGFNGMLISCVHEMTHAQGEPWHNEDFVSRFESNMTKVLNNSKIINKLRRSV